MSTMNEELSPWSHAQQKCWKHVKSATDVTGCCTMLSNISVASVIPILSETPTILVTPTNAESLSCVQLTCSLIKLALGISTPWDHMSISGEWVFRLRTDMCVVDVMTRIPSTSENRVEI